MQVKIPQDEKNPLNAAIEEITTQVDLLKKEITSLRKSGIDATIVSLKSSNLPYKVKVLEQTKDPKDLNNIKKIIEDVRKEMEELRKASEKKEE